MTDGNGSFGQEAFPGPEPTSQPQPIPLPHQRPVPPPPGSPQQPPASYGHAPQATVGYGQQPPYGQPPYGQAPYGQPETKTTGVISLVLGILSIITCCLGIILGPIAIVVGVNARKHHSGATLGTAGLITGALGSLGGLVSAALFIWAGLNPYEEFDTSPTVMPTVSEQPAYTDEPIESPMDEFGGSQTQATPCYAFDVPAEWILQSTQDEVAMCDASIELWMAITEDASGALYIDHTALGGPVAIVRAEPLSSRMVTEVLPADDPAAAVAYMEEQYFGPSGTEILGWTESSLGGRDAVRLLVDTGISDFRAVYLVWAPEPYDPGNSDTISGFLVTISSQYDEILLGDDLEVLVVDSWSWR